MLDMIFNRNVMKSFCDVWVQPLWWDMVHWWDAAGAAWHAYLSLSIYSHCLSLHYP